jgi:hypothetical protein
MTDLIIWALDQINPLSMFLLILLIVVSALLGMATVGVCGVHA